MLIVLLTPISTSANSSSVPQDHIVGKYYPSLLITQTCGIIIHIQGVSVGGRLLSMTYKEFEETPQYQKMVLEVFDFLKNSNQIPNFVDIKRGKCT